VFRRRAKKTTGSEPGPSAASAEAGTEHAESTAARPRTASGTPSETPAQTGSAKPPRPNGPWDVSELDGSHGSHALPRLDLGGLRIRPLPGMQVQMQVDQATGKATSVLLAEGPAAVQLMAIAAAKSASLWPSTMAAITADATRRRGSAKQGTGPWGPVLQLAVPASTPDGKTGVQPSVVLGIDGPRWMLRATMIGKAAVDQDTMNRMIGVVRDAVVVRGEHPMPPGEFIPLTPPPRPEPGADDEPSDSRSDAPEALGPDQADAEAGASGAPT